VGNLILAWSRARRIILASLVAAVVLLAAGTAEAVISISVTTSKPTGCVAPCTVYFDATGSTGLSGSTARLTNGDYVGAAWYWDFDSTGVNTGGEPHRNTMGHVVAHLYETPGTYSACVGVIDTLGNAAGPSCTSITVGAGSWTTYYASNAGSGTTCTIGSPCSLATALTHMGTNVRILLNRGDTFTRGSSGLFLTSVTGPFLIGAFGTGATPHLVFTNDTPFHITGSTDIKIVDVHTTDTGLTGPFCNGEYLTGAYADITLLRVEMDGSATEAGAELIQSDATGTNTAFVDGSLHTFNGYGWFAAGPIRAAIIGSQIYDEHGQDHAFRWQSCKESGPSSGVCGDGSRIGSHLYVAENNVDCGTDTFDCGTFRGTFANGVMAFNTMTDVVSTGPQNADPGTYEYPENVSFIGNTINAPATINGGGCIHVTAKHVYVVDNVCSFTNVGVQSDPAAPIDGWPDELYIFNNSFTYPDNGDTASTPRMLSWGNATAAATVQVKNNIYLLTNSNLHRFGNGFLISAGAATVVEDYNLTYAPADPTGWTHPSGAHDIYADPKFASTTVGASNAWRLLATSPAIAAGTAVAAYRDAVTIVRVAPFDIGAYSFVAPAAAIGRAYLFFSGGGF
jgi:hypothetical protein